MPTPSIAQLMGVLVFGSSSPTPVTPKNSSDPMIVKIAIAEESEHREHKQLQVEDRIDHRGELVVVPQLLLDEDREPQPDRPEDYPDRNWHSTNQPSERVPVVVHATMMPSGRREDSARLRAALRHELEHAVAGSDTSHFGMSAFVMRSVGPPTTSTNHTNPLAS